MALTTWLLITVFVIWSVVGLAAFYTVMLAGLFDSHARSNLTLIAVLAGPVTWAVIVWMTVWNWLERRKMRKWR